MKHSNIPLHKNLNNCKTIQWVHSHPDFVPANDKGDLATPGVDKAGPAGVDGDVLAVSRTETGRGVVERLAGVLQNCWQQEEERL